MTASETVSAGVAPAGVATTPAVATLLLLGTAISVVVKVSVM